MFLYRAEENTIHFCEDNNTFEAKLPEKASSYDRPTVNKDGRYIASAPMNRIYVYDKEACELIEAPFKFKHNVFGALRFDEHNRIYYIEGNTIGRWKIGESSPEVLFTMKRATHGPSDLGVSPSGRYVSFLKYRSDSNYLYILDTETGECKDLKFSVYHYIWTDETHIAWTKSGGLKLLDIETGKSKLLIKDHTTLAKKANKEDAAILPYVTTKDNPYLTADIDLLGIFENRLWFSLYVFKSNHDSIWSVGLDGTCPKCGYVPPYEIASAFRKAVAGWKYFVSGGLSWTKENRLHIYDGESYNTLSSDWRPVVLYTSRNR